MALIKCPECNREVSDKAKVCVHCGYILSEEQEKRASILENKNISKKAKVRRKIKPWQMILIIIGVFLVLFVGFLVLGAKVSSEVNETKDNITPYLEYIGKYVPDDGHLDIDDELYEKRGEVFFMGMKGTVQYYTEDNYVHKCTWDSDEEFSEEDYQKKIDDLYVYFGEEPIYDTSSYHTGDTFFYYWTDPNNNFSVTCSRDFFGYDSPGRLEISWEAEGDVLEAIKEIPENNIDEIDEEEWAETNTDLEIGVVENIHTAADIPDALMNDEFKNVIDLFSKGFSESGLDISDAETYDDGETYIFYLDNLEFLGDECDDSHLQPRIIYEKDAIENNGIPSEIYFGYYNPLKSNGYEETVEKVEDIAKALDISDEGLIDNDYTSSSKLAVGDYATFTFINLGLELIVSNTDGEVEIEIVPVD